jgi:hypothetical protein
MNHDLLTTDHEDFPTNPTVMDREKTRTSKVNRALNFLNNGKSYQYVKLSPFKIALVIIITILIQVSLVLLTR